MQANATKPAAFTSPSKAAAKAFAKAMRAVNAQCTVYRSVCTFTVPFKGVTVAINYIVVMV